jgi:glycosyltransferase involved in cell wall biosynthesis
MTFGNICIITHEYMMMDGSKRSVGGIQSYVDALAQLLCSRCRQLVIIQPSDRDFNIQENPKVVVVGVKGRGYAVGHHFRTHYAKVSDLTICTYMSWIKWCSHPRLIGIHHGIDWDGFGSKLTGFLRAIRKIQYSRITLWRLRQMQFRNVQLAAKTICVDLNFPNWLRATYPCYQWEEKLCYIPNFGDLINTAELERKLGNRNRNLNVLISRRFEKVRGLPLMAQIVADIHDKWPHATFVFAGWGTQKDRMQALLKDKDRCKIVRLTPEEVKAANEAADIAVIPTMWSEGTSFSCVEGLCAGAAILATNVGGLGNIILPDFNGLLVAPKYADIRSGLEELLANQELRIKIARNGYETAKSSFSREVWNRRILSVLQGFK